MTDQVKKVRHEGGIEVMKASAGSGKTYSLAREYIRLLLSATEPFAHRHILAVTFTNKATDEMKSRIVDELDTLARFTELSSYRNYLMEECGFESEAHLQARASKALSEMLSDYGAFSVCTIDKFFQQTLRAFSREIGQVAEYRVELDRQSIVSESVDRLLDSLGENTRELLKWLSESSIEQIEQGSGYHLASSLNEFADGYLSASFQDKLKALEIDEKKAFAKENVARLRKTCRDIMASVEQEYNASALRLCDAIDACDSKVAGKYMKDLPQKIKNDGIDALKEIHEKKYWQKVSEDSSHPLYPYVSEMNVLLGQPMKSYRTAKIIDRQAYVFRVAEALKSSFDQLLAEKNVLGLDDTNTILRDIIGNTEAPFIYEKTGTRYKHFLLDEFQDTSCIQWDCFLPLLRNSMAEGAYNLVVGDVKQSIYRWRDADWHILGQRLEAELGPYGNVVPNPLETNYRSASNIVGFNNGLYSRISESSGLGAIYGNVEQAENHKFEGPGCVQVVSYVEDWCASVLAEVIDAHTRGFAWKDIAVIVRTNAMGGDAAQALIEAEVPVMTSDSLLICNGLSVRQVVAGLFKIDDEHDKINAFMAPDFELEKLEASRSMTETAEILFGQLPADQVKADTLYVLAFMDLIRDYVSRNGNSLHGFLQYWKESGMKKSICSPDTSDAVTIITIHKCKGLDFPYVVLPVKPERARPSKSWEHPDMSDMPAFEGCEDALYNVTLGKGLENTCFEASVEREDKLNTVDSANTWYVATTRASQEMSILIPQSVGSAGFPYQLAEYVNTPESGFVKVEPKEEEEPLRFVLGEPSQKQQPRTNSNRRSKPKPQISQIDLCYSATGSSRGSVRISQDSSEYFEDEGRVSARRRGTILHSILEQISTEQDIEREVAAAQQQGRLSSAEAAQAGQMLAQAVRGVSSRGWFAPDADVVAERDIILPSGAVMRPDRVVIKDGGVDIIDYKFGKEHEEYRGQVGRYMNCYTRMGYAGVRGFIWYVERGEVEEVDPLLIP